jgi:hypothetical protein
MTQSEFDHLMESLDVLSPEQVERLRRELDNRLAVSTTSDANEAMQRRLMEAGLLSEVKPPITDLSVYRNRRAVPIQGEPLSETVTRERR